MTDLHPNTGKVEKSGTNVRVPVDLLGGDRYRLVLCPNMSNTNAVLVIKMTLQFQFEDGKSQAAATKDQKLTWTVAEKQKFAAGFVSAVKDVWDDQFVIRTDSTLLVSAYREIRVQFQFKTIIDTWDTSDDYELSVAKIDTGTWSSSCVDTSLDDSDLDSEDLTPASKGNGRQQRGGVHEFGHMLGMRDEYPPQQTLQFTNPNRRQDSDSVMHSAETVRPRHYAPFAAWLTDQYSNVAVRGQAPVVFKVDDGNGTQ